MTFPIDKKKIAAYLPYVIFFWGGDKLAFSCRTDSGNVIAGLMKGIAELFHAPLFSFNPLDMLIGVITALTVRGVLYLRSKNAKKFRKGIEYGSARWGTAEDIKPFMDSDFKNNLLLTATERLTMNPRPKNPKYARNKNVMVIGGSGSGKTRAFIKPNLMQCMSNSYPTSFVVTDPKGTV